MRRSSRPPRPPRGKIKTARSCPLHSPTTGTMETHGATAFLDSTPPSLLRSYKPSRSSTSGQKNASGSARKAENARRASKEVESELDEAEKSVTRLEEAFSELRDEMEYNATVHGAVHDEIKRELARLRRRRD